ncbi:uncharacterized protein J3R85_018518 [Psidium guajava]|nr:uncharacterized protein J3R85_018518 [Psidium guajava]
MKMASSRVFLLCGLLLAVLVLMTAEVSARDLSEETQSQENMKDGPDGHHCHHHCGHHGGDHLHPLEETEDGHHGHEEHHHGGHGEHGHGGHHGGHPLEQTEEVKN